MIHVVQNKMSVWWRKKNTKAVKIQLYVFKKKVRIGLQHNKLCKRRELQNTVQCKLTEHKFQGSHHFNISNCLKHV